MLTRWISSVLAKEDNKIIYHCYLQYAARPPTRLQGILFPSDRPIVKSMVRRLRRQSMLCTHVIYVLLFEANPVRGVDGGRESKGGEDVVPVVSDTESCGTLGVGSIVRLLVKTTRRNDLSTAGHILHVLNGGGMPLLTDCCRSGKCRNSCREVHEMLEM